MPAHEYLLDRLLIAWSNKEERRDQLRDQVLERMRSSDPIDCTGCGAKIPRGQGMGKASGPWPDKSKPRPMVITPLCLACMGKRVSDGKDHKTD